MGQIGCAEASATNYDSTLCNITEERRFHLHRGGNLYNVVILVFFIQHDQIPALLIGRVS